MGIRGSRNLRLADQKTEDSPDFGVLAIVGCPFPSPNRSRVPKSDTRPDIRTIQTSAIRSFGTHIPAIGYCKIRFRPSNIQFRSRTPLPVRRSLRCQLQKSFGLRFRLIPESQIEFHSQFRTHSGSKTSCGLRFRPYRDLKNDLRSPISSLASLKFSFQPHFGLSKPSNLRFWVSGEPSRGRCPRFHTSCESSDGLPETFSVAVIFNNFLKPAPFRSILPGKCGWSDLPFRLCPK